VSKIGEREKQSGRKVFRHEPHEDRGRHLSPLNDAELHKPRDDTGSVGQGHAREIGERGERQFVGGASERPEDPALCVRYKHLNRPAKVHYVSVSLIDERFVSSMRGLKAKPVQHPPSGTLTPSGSESLARSPSRTLGQIKSEGRICRSPFVVHHIAAQSLTYDLDANPVFHEQPSCVSGESGVMETGVALFDAFDAGGRDAGAWEVQDGCDGHPQLSSEYHYHTLSSYITDTDVSTVIGWALDGFPITGPPG